MQSNQTKQMESSKIWTFFLKADNKKVIGMVGKQGELLKKLRKVKNYVGLKHQHLLWS